MNAEEYEARFDEQIDMMVGLYNIICKLLSFLPIPIATPALWDAENGTTPTAEMVVSALVRTRSILVDMPADPRQTVTLDLAVVEWLGAFDMCNLIGSALEGGQTEGREYRLEALTLAIGRIFALTDEARTHLDL